MKIGFIGGGSFGKQLALLLSAAGHDVLMGLRDPGKATGTSHRQGTLREAAAHGEVVIVAIPYTVCSEVLPSLRASLRGKIVVDATNPLNEDWSPILLGQENCAAETLARLLPEVRLVKAFNTIFANVMEVASRGEDRRALTAFVAGDDGPANQVVARLASDAGFEPVVTGVLRNSRYLEAMAHLNIQMAVVHGGGTNAGFFYRQNL